MAINARAAERQRRGGRKPGGLVELPGMTDRITRTATSSVTRLIAVTALLASAVLAGNATGASAPSAAATPRARCGPGSLPETAAQGRVPAKDYADGRAARGYTCNTKLVAHFGTSGGYKVLRYVDRHGHVCGFYDTTLLFPANAGNAAEGLGEYVLDMHNPAHPVHTATLDTTPAMLSPHESVLLNAKRGLLVADMGYPTYNPGFVDVFDVSQDCRHPVQESSTPLGVLGHESGFSPDGKTFYVSSTGGKTLTAVDLTNPALPSVLFTEYGPNYHGMRVSDDGKYLYIADIGDPGLTILDVSQIQKRVANPQVKQVAHITWPNVSIPQVPIPVTIHHHKYLFEVDEFSKSVTSYSASDPVGAARLINIDNVRKPYVVSNVRLEVNQPSARSGDQQNDPQATNGLQGYAGHYCSVPREVDPEIVACSFILSGERVFNIQNPRHPREVAYFNMPRMPSTTSTSSGAYAMSQAAWDLKRHEVWYSDGNSGFYVFKVTNGAWPSGL
jgi:hypothetical protein